jgi:hypothetical protein
MGVGITGRGALPRLAAAFCAGAIGCGRADVGPVPANPAAPGREAAGPIAENRAASEADPAMGEPYRRDSYGVPIGPPIPETRIVIGDLVLTMPHLVNRVVDLVLLPAEAKLGIVVAGREGQRPAIMGLLTLEQVRQIRQDIQAGRRAELIQPDGETTLVSVRLGRGAELIQPDDKKTLGPVRLD